MQRGQAKSASYMANIKQDLNPESTGPKSHRAKPFYISLQILSASPASGVFGHLDYFSCTGATNCVCKLTKFTWDTPTRLHLIPTLHSPHLLALRFNVDIEAQRATWKCGRSWCPVGKHLTRGRWKAMYKFFIHYPAKILPLETIAQPSRDCLSEMYEVKHVWRDLIQGREVSIAVGKARIISKKTSTNDLIRQHQVEAGSSQKHSQKPRQT